MVKSAFSPFCLVPILLAAALFAQAPTAELTGTIRDASGAVVPDTQVTATNDATGLSREVRSNELGFYTVPLLPPGVYTMMVQKEGFRSVKRSGLRLHVSDKVTVDYTLELGSLAETVSVSAETPLLQTEQASQGAVIDNSKIVNLPLNGRNPFSLAALAPGVQPGGGFFTARVFQESVNQGNFVANGGASFQNDILMDGTSNTVAGHGQLAMTPSVDAPLKSSRYRPAVIRRSTDAAGARSSTSSPNPAPTNCGAPRTSSFAPGLCTSPEAERAS